MADQGKIKVGIVGAGIGGLSLLAGLQKLPHLEAHLYEASPKITGDEGANVGLSSNAQIAMELIDPAVRKALDLAGSVKQTPSARMYMGTGPESGKHIMDIHDKLPQAVVLRSMFIAELSKILDPSSLHPGKKLARIEEKSEAEKDTVTLHFTDGTQADFDAVIGCDGIHSNVRKHILGADHPAATPVFSGLYSLIGLVPMDHAKAKLGAGLFEPPLQTEWLKKDGLILYDVCNNGQTVQIIVAGWTDEAWDSAAWIRPASVEDLKEELQGFNSIEKGVYELLENTKLFYASVWEHLDAPFYNRGKVCIMGDAAHAFTPFMGSGAGQACEDALTLYKLLGEVRTPAHCAEAFKIYSETRLDRSQAIAKASRETGNIQFGRTEIGQDVQKLREALEHRWEFIKDIDLPKVNEDAIRRLQTAIRR